MAQNLSKNLTLATQPGIEYTKAENGLILPTEERKRLAIENNKKENHESVKVFFDHNTKIKNIHEKYQSVKPVNGNILVRCFVTEPNYYPNTDMYLIPTLEINVPSKSGYNFESVPNPYPYSSKAIIVSVDETYNNYKEGQIVQLHPSAIAVLPVQGTTYVDTPKRFTHYSELNDSITLGHENYGYLMINSRDIICLINE